MVSLKKKRHFHNLELLNYFKLAISSSFTLTDFDFLTVSFGYIPPSVYIFIISLITSFISLSKFAFVFFTCRSYLKLFYATLSNILLIFFTLLVCCFITTLFGCKLFKQNTSIDPKIFGLIASSFTPLVFVHLLCLTLNREFHSILYFLCTSLMSFYLVSSLKYIYEVRDQKAAFLHSIVHYCMYLVTLIIYMTSIKTEVFGLSISGLFG